jgi:hypothetical protein
MNIPFNNLIKRLPSILLVSSICLISTVVLAKKPVHGEKKYFDMSFGDAFLDKYHTKPIFNLKDGADGTYWVWRWQDEVRTYPWSGLVRDIYPHFRLTCTKKSPNDFCALDLDSIEYLTINTEQRFKATATSNFGHLQRMLNQRFDNRTLTTTKRFVLKQAIVIFKPNTYLYGNLIALDKYIPAAPIKGLWVGTNKYKTQDKVDVREYQWDGESIIAHWEGHIFRNHIHYRCVTDNLSDIAVGGTLPPECTLPKIKYSENKPVSTPPGEFWD